MIAQIENNAKFSIYERSKYEGFVLSNLDGFIYGYFEFVSYFETTCGTKITNNLETESVAK